MRLELFASPAQENLSTNFGRDSPTIVPPIDSVYRGRFQPVPSGSAFRPSWGRQSCLQPAFNPASSPAHRLLKPLCAFNPLTRDRMGRFEIRMTREE
jgi:hypothetical protein